MDKLKILVIDQLTDHSAKYKKVLGKVIESTGLAVAEHFASTKTGAIETLAQVKFDVVLLDSAMPGTVGMGLLKIIKKNFPETEVIMTCDTGEYDVTNTFDALSKGALDFVIKPEVNGLDKSHEFIKNHLYALFTQIIVKKYAAAALMTTSRIKRDEGHSTTAKDKSLPIQKTNYKEVDIVVIAASTGGPRTLETVLSALPKNFKKPILVVQHMPAEFTKVFSDALDRKCSLNVSEGAEGDVVKPGHILIAPGGRHMIVLPDKRPEKMVSMKDTPHVNGVRPSADVLFSSVASAYEGKGILAVILTGMGSDGLKGVIEMKKRCSCYCITQSEKTCVVYGMPRRIDEAGMSDESADLKSVSDRIQQYVLGRSCEISE